MTIQELRCALRGVSAYRHLIDGPMLGLNLALLDALAAGDGSGAVEGYARLFYALRQENYPNLGLWLLRYTESPMPAWWSAAGATPPWSPPPGGTLRRLSSWRSWTVTS